MFPDVAAGDADDVADAADAVAGNLGPWDKITAMRRRSPVARTANFHVRTTHTPPYSLWIPTLVSAYDVQVVVNL